MNALKASQDNDTTTKLLCKKWAFSETSFYKVSVHVWCFSFPSVDNLINITFVWKQGARDSQENYKPALYLKYSQKITLDKTNFSLLDNLFAKYWCWLTQSFVAQHCPRYLTAKWRTSNYKRKVLLLLRLIYLKPSVVFHITIFVKCNTYVISFSSIGLIGLRH